MATAPAETRRRVRARVVGTVQGVGFRPYVYRLASELGLDGWVFNDSRGVVVEVESAPPVVERFLERLAPESPPLARVERVLAESIAPTFEPGFAIRESPRAGRPDADVSADTATCEDCLRELLDPADRRHRYPFINCTNCGPRFTIVRGVPYDRPLTTMAGFRMCAACEAEYADPADRRFHAQPNACPQCGPTLTLLDRNGAPAALGPGALDLAIAELGSGAIAAVKGVGGYHLACRADDEHAVAALRARKHREAKPFALLAADVAAARALAHVRPADEELLTSPARPIVLMPRLPGAPVAAAVAPASRDLGVMLPYSPLHHLLAAGCATPLVLTSGNVSDEPIAYRDEDALERLSNVADLFLVHDRPIQTRTDDSVARTVQIGERRRPMLARRSRGYVPAALALPIAAEAPILACGAELKNTFCVAKGARAWVGHHIGDLENAETLGSFTEGIEHFQRLFAVAPRIVAHDLHPEYLSTKYALEREGVELVAVQHHHAHLAACLAEHGRTEAAVGAIFDGTGLGTDGTIWGGELLFGDLRGFERDGLLWPVRLPGGAAAIRSPWRMARVWLEQALDEPPELPARLAGRVSAEDWDQVGRLAASGLASPLTSSAGRLFDAVSALCAICTEVSYEGQAAIELEAACDPHEDAAYPMPVLQRERLVLDARATVREIAADLAEGVPVPIVASRFHNGLADAVATACAEIARRRRAGTVLLSGGTFQNRRLVERAAAQLGAAGLEVLTPELLPPGDGGIAYGQAAVAAATRPAGGAR
jgi:hydrogenase maturation protein HypF